jgi:hypothetical protein
MFSYMYVCMGVGMYICMDVCRGTPAVTWLEEGNYVEVEWDGEWWQVCFHTCMCVDM